MFKSIPTGMQKGAQIIFYIFIVSGVFGIIRSTGAIEAGINKGVRHLAGREILRIPASMLLFSIGGFAMGMAEETIIFVLIGIALARAMGFDAVTGTAMVTLGAASGFIGGMLNPFTVGIAQSLAQIPLFSGLAFRSVVYVFVLGFAIWYVMRYAYKVKADPTQSVIHDLEYASIQDEREEVAISCRGHVPDSISDQPVYSFRQWTGSSHHADHGAHRRPFGNSKTGSRPRLPIRRCDHELHHSHFLGSDGVPGCCRNPL